MPRWRSIRGSNMVECDTCGAAARHGSAPHSVDDCIRGLVMGARRYAERLVMNPPQSGGVLSDSNLRGVIELLDRVDALLHRGSDGDSEPPKH